MNRHKWGPTEQRGATVDVNGPLDAAFVARCQHCKTVKAWVMLPFRRAPKFLTYTTPSGNVTNLAPECEPLSAAARTLSLFDHAKG